MPEQLLSVLRQGAHIAGMHCEVSEQARQLRHEDERQAVHQQEQAAGQEEPADHVPGRALAAAETFAQHLQLASPAPDRQSLEVFVQPADIAGSDGHIHADFARCNDNQYFLFYLKSQCRDSTCKRG